jgi:hypothetical protein
MLKMPFKLIQSGHEMVPNHTFYHACFVSPQTTFCLVCQSVGYVTRKAGGVGGSLHHCAMNQAEWVLTYLADVMHWFSRCGTAWHFSTFNVFKDSIYVAMAAVGHIVLLSPLFLG